MGSKELMGALRVRVKRGINLAVRDVSSSDPYVVIQMNESKVRTRAVKSSCFPEWNEELTLAVFDPNIPIILNVFDHDVLSKDDPMGEAEIDIKEYVECMVMMQEELRELPAGTVVKRVQPSSRRNCLAEESMVVWMGNGKLLQDMILRLNNVERGQVELQIEWLHTANNT